MADTAPPEPVTLAEAKLNLRVDGSDEDARITSLIVAARQAVERMTGLVLTPRTVTETVPTLGRSIDLIAWPVTAITEIRHPDADGALAVLPSDQYRVSLKRRPVRIIPASFNWGLAPGWNCWPFDRHHHHRERLPVEIDIEAGYATPDDVPEAIKQAMHLLIGHFYTNRSAVDAGVRAAAVELPLGVEALLDSDNLQYV